jgi:hypothetical protein
VPGVFRFSAGRQNAAGALRLKFEFARWIPGERHFAGLMPSSPDNLARPRCK